MSNFQKDVQLLADLQGLIEKREKQVNPPEGSTAIMGAISPVLRAAMPAAQKAAQRELDILVRGEKPPGRADGGSEMSARREHRLRNLERRVAELETIAATPVFIHTKGDGGEDYVLEAVWSKEEADTHPDKRLSLLDRLKNIFTGGHEK